LEPGRTLRFALLPEGQDPDDLVRASGPAAMEAVLKGARPLADMLWAREVDAGPLDTPDHRAALEHRLREAVALIRDESLRRHYRDDVRTRMATLPGAFNARREAWPRRAAPAFASRRSPASPRAGLHLSPVLARSALWTGHGTESPREALILSMLLADPDRLESHVEPLSELELSGSDARALRAFLLDCAGGGEPLDTAVLRARLERAGLSEAAERLRKRVTPGDRWALGPGADPERLDNTLRQAMALHRKARALHSELRAAERALAAEGGEVELSWLREVQSQLSSLDGAEADRDDGAGRDARDG
jgi:DNA primase